MRALILCLVAAPFLFSQQPDDKEDLKNPVAGKPDAISAGRKLFVEGCSGCHGSNAEGGRGPNLSKGDQIRGASNRQLVEILTEGVKGSDMPPSGLAPDKTWQLIAYLRNFTAVAYDSNASGDAAAGSALFFGAAGCSNCHTIRGRGGFPGPDLSNIGRQRSFRQLRESVVDPDAQISEGYGAVTVTTNSGRSIAGVARDNTNYAIQILDARGDIHRLLKKDLREVTLQPASLMPHDYKQRLTAADLENILAFLSRQSIRQDAPAPGPLSPRRATACLTNSFAKAPATTGSRTQATMRHTGIAL